MGVTTIWALEQDKFDESDLSWCRGLGVEIKVEPLCSHVYTHAQISQSVVIGLKIRLTTTCEKQETMLKLKYGSRLIAVNRSITIPYD
jgi:hypothetical protein